MRKLLPVLFCLFVLSGCRWAGRVSHRPTDHEHMVQIDRYDRVLDEFVSLNSYSAQQKMNLEYPVQTKMLIEDVLGIGHVNDPDVEKKLRIFYLDSTVQVLLDEVHRQFVDMSDIQRQLTAAFTLLEREDSAFVRPHIYTQISCLNQSIVVADTLVGISLDKYLGADYPLYERYFPANQRESMTRENIVVDALTFYLLYRYVEPAHAPVQLGSEESLAAIARVHWVVAHILGVPPRSHIVTNDRDIDLSQGLAAVDAYMKRHPKTSLIHLLTRSPSPRSPLKGKRASLRSKNSRESNKL